MSKGCPECGASMMCVTMPDSGRFEVLCKQIMNLRLLRHMSLDKRPVTHADVKP